MKKENLITIKNPSSPYYNEKGKIINYLPDEQAEVFLVESENIVVLNLVDINQNKNKFIPKSRKEYYQYILDLTTSRADIVEVTENLIQENLIIISESYNKDALISLMMDLDLDKHQLIEEFRLLRDDGKLDFKLINNLYEEQNSSKFHNKKHKKKFLP